MKNIKKYKYHLPIVGKLIKDRDVLVLERDNLKIILNSKSTNTNSKDLKNISNKYSKQISWVKKYLKGKKNIFDVGTGPNGSDWWQDIDKGSKIVGIDYFFFPSSVPKNVTIYKYDASKLNLIKYESHLEKYIKLNKFTAEKVNLTNNFDLVVANHILEHVSNPENLIEGISKLLKKGGIVYVGFPDYRNFTDIFYHLVHPDGGGHIQQLTNDYIQDIFKKNGFKLVECNIWPDDWLWFQSCYNPKNYNINFINQGQIKHMCDIFRKELTPQKGYFYGWEMVFKKL